MKKLLNLKSMLTLLVLVFATASFASAQIEAPRDAHGSEYYVLDKNEVIGKGGMFLWKYAEIESVEGFRFYRSTDGGNAFDLVGEAYVETDSIMKTGYGLWMYTIGFDLEEDLDSNWFKITAFLDGEESEASNSFMLKENNHQPKDKISIISKPVVTTIVNEEYVYDVEHQTNLDEPEISYELIVQGIPDGENEPSIDEETGEITWQPESRGVFFFTVFVSAKGGGAVVTAQQQFQVRVVTCENLSIITGYVVDENDYPVNSGMVYLFNEDFMDKPANNGIYTTARFDNGYYTLDNVDEGKYYMMVIGHGKNSHQGQYYNWWYSGAKFPEEATLLEITCDDTLFIDAVLEEKPMPKLYSVSGLVTDEETGEPIKYATVEFIGEEQNANSVIRKVFSTDNNGEYKVELPDTYDYKAVGYKASWHVKKGDTIQKIQYFHEYYDNVSEPSEATVLNLTEDLENIDFSLEPVPNYENSVTGFVKDVDGEALDKAWVIAFLVEAYDEEFTKYLYAGHTMTSNSDGSFSFNSLIPGEYVLLGYSIRGHYAPGYYLEGEIATLNWEDATRVTVEEEGNSGDYTITLDSYKNKFGKGKCMGIISKNQGGKLNTGGLLGADRVHGANVSIVDADGKVVKSVQTDEYGEFEATGLAAGEYTMVVDKVGLATHEETLVIDEENPAIKDVTMQPVVGSSVEELVVDNVEIAVAPNPVSETLQVAFDSDGGFANVRVIDMQGVEIHSNSLNTIQGINRFDVDATEFAPGAYMLVISNGNSTISTKFVVGK
jgi:hypothetical protein